MTSISTSPVLDYLPQAMPGLSDGPSPRLNSPGPLPLPDFTFPARRPSPIFPSSAPASLSRSTGRRPLSAVELREPSNNTSTFSNAERLPAFSFGSLPPVSPRTISRPGTSQSHHRNLSEYIGGESTAPLSTSPTRSEHNLPPPAASRRHAHRRSAAISQNDLSLILKPGPSSPRGSSAPTSPAVVHGYQNAQQFPASLDSAVQPSPDPEQSIDSEDFALPKTIKNTRVGFSDDVQIIPRPLSLVSSDSASTVRPGHSVSNSMSSVMSGTSSPPIKDKRNLTPSNNPNEMRPRTAEPILLREGPVSPIEPRRRGSLPLLSDTAAAGLPSPSTPRSAKKWSFFGHETHSGDSSPKSRPTSAASSVKDIKSPLQAPESADNTTNNTPVRSTELSSSRRSSISRKPSKKQKKVRSWAGSILGRKSRQRSQKQKLSRRSPTPPLRSYTPMEDPQSFDFNETDRNPPKRPELNTDFATWKPRQLSPQEESMSPIIDLDAALGPFNTPSSFGTDWESSQRPGIKKRAMHSAAGLAGFTGPGMHYHRRAESAPEFENPRFGLHRLGSSSTMAMEDVFEEDEDEEWEDTKASSDKESSIKAGDAEDEGETGLGIDIKVVDSDGMDIDRVMDFEEGSFQKSIKRKDSGLSDGERRNMSSTKSEHSAVSLLDEYIEEEEPSPVEIMDDSIPSRPESRAKSSDSTATPPFRANMAKELAPVDFHAFSLQAPSPTSPRSTIQSSLPSPRSPFSYDTQRISTAPSSITDENAFQSLLLGEPGPELRMSVDDVPSLTSSNSTMTRESMAHPGAGNPQFRDGQRSASLSSAAVTRKRSSMASLSRLISSSHGEKSKLSIESRAPATIEAEKKEKTSKSKRISRLMQFWKPKETAS